MFFIILYQHTPLGGTPHRVLSPLELFDYFQNQFNEVKDLV